jgi:signal transduction histidine kinase
MDTIGQLTGGIAHDFSNMLAVVLSGLGLIKRQLARGDHNFEPLIEASIAGAQRAADLTRRLMIFARQQPLAPQVLDINKAVASLSELLRRTIGEHVRLETVLAGGLWPAHVDPGLLENSLVNLATNARDAMPDGGKLTIETSNAYLDEVYAAQHTEVTAGQYVLVAVTDTGTGMTPDTLSRVYEPFYTTKPIGEGTGHGLAQVFGFVKQSQGHIKIYSEPGRGTTVKLS